MTVAVAVAMPMVMPVVVAVVTTMALMGPVVGIDGHEAQCGQELGELEAAVVVGVGFGEELLDVVVGGGVGLRGDRRGAESLGVTLPVPSCGTRLTQQGLNPKKTLPPFGKLPAAPIPKDPTALGSSIPRSVQGRIG